MARQRVKEGTERNDESSTSSAAKQSNLQLEKKDANKQKRSLKE